MDDSTLLPYLAGLIDGEGHIGIGVSKNPKGERRWYLRFACHQVNPAPLLLLKERFGGSIVFTERNGTHRSLHEWLSGSMLAYEAIKALRPWLIVKAAEADLAIEYQEVLLARGTRRSPLSAEEQEKRESLYRRMRDLKHLDYEREESTFKVTRIAKPKPPKKVRVKVSEPVRGEWKKGKKPNYDTVAAQYEEYGPLWMAREHGVSRQTVYNWLDSYSIPRAGREAGERRRIAALRNVWHAETPINAAVERVIQRRKDEQVLERMAEAIPDAVAAEAVRQVLPPRFEA
jgi:hypothetical protein